MQSITCLQSVLGQVSVLYQPTIDKEMKRYPEQGAAASVKGRSKVRISAL